MTRQLRILVSASRLGSAGGNQRAVHSWLRALSEHDVWVAARQIDDGPYSDLPAGTCTIPNWRLVGPVARRPLSYWRVAARATRPRLTFDAYLHFWNGRDLSALYRAEHRFLIPAGDHLGGFEARFDRVLSQSPGGLELIGDPSKHLVVPPPTYPLATKSEAVPGLPARYLLTVLNPYGPVKGAEVIGEAAARSSLPIVWARSSRFDGRIPEIKVPETVVQVVDAEPAKLKYLYENCAAYVSLSRTEGYGWAIADALMEGKPVISRRVGVLTLFPKGIEGIYEYSSTAELIDALRLDCFNRPTLDLQPIQASEARSKIETLCWHG